MQAILVLHDIRSAQNVGSLFRTSDAVGISKIYLSSITPSPIDRFGRDRNDISKTALGAEKTVLWEQYENIKDLVEKYKSKGYQIIAIEQSENSLDYKNVKATEKTVFILGNEVEGLPNDLLSIVDVVAQIPMAGNKESLNVSVAGGIALFRILDK
ncbi:MAG: TrmH family RNA methyltransferase [Candidatus Pacebacteria bacterium]|nr:TrmH family RNA methyltransferase [Candidatus Paceibacterota bacterium]